MATYSWATGISGDWNTGTLWSTGTPPNDPTADVVIDAIPSPGTTTSYQVTIGAGETVTINSLALNATNNVLGPNSNPYTGATLQVGGDAGAATLIFGSGGNGNISGPLQNFMVVENGSTIVNAGTIDAFVQTLGNGVELFTQDGSAPDRGIYFTNWLQALGTVTVAAKIAEYDDTKGTLWDGIFEAKGPTAVINLGGKDLAGTDHIVTIGTMTGPPDIPEGWTQLIFEENGQINEWDGTKYVSVESTLTRIENRATLTINNSNYTTPDTFSIGTLAAIHQTGGTLTTGTLTIDNGGSLLAVGTLKGDVINNGVILVNPDSPLVNGTPTGTISAMTFLGSINGTGTMTFANDGTLEIGVVGKGETVFMDGKDTLILDSPGSFQGLLQSSGDNTVILKGVTADTATWLTTNQLQFSYKGVVVDSIATTGGYSGASFTLSTAGTDTTMQMAGTGVVCFARGTRIRTPDGDIAIEELKPGQHVVTADGNVAAIKWIGHRRVNCQRHPDPRKVWPVRIKGGAFGRGLPRRDLLVSPQHALFTEGVLIPARYLINGRNVVQQEVDSIEYFHIELGCHDILLAEGLPAESYLDTGDRKNFDNNKGPVALHPDFGLWCWDSRACTELKVTGAEVDAVRARLLARARASRRSRRVAAA
jgi:hypothetical protein